MDVSTVSRALRGDERVKAKTKERISVAATSLGYRPNVLAKLLQRGQSSMLCFLAPDLGNAVDCEIVEHASAIAAEENYHLLISLHFGRQEYFHSLTEHFTAGLAAGAIVNSRGVDWLAELSSSLLASIPLVFLDVPSGSSQYTSVTTDQAMGVRGLLSRCWEDGCRTCVSLFHAQDNLVEKRRYEASMEVCAQMGMRVIPPVSNGDVMTAQGNAAIEGKVAVIGSSREIIDDWLPKMPERIGNHPVIAACFDGWRGSLDEYARAHVAVQNYRKIAALAIERLLLLINRDPTVDKANEIVVPIQSFRTIDQ